MLCSNYCITSFPGILLLRSHSVIPNPNYYACNVTAVFGCHLFSELSEIIQNSSVGILVDGAELRIQ